MAPLRRQLDPLAALVLGTVLAAGCVQAEVGPTASMPSPTVELETVTPLPPTPTAHPGACPVPAGDPGPVNLIDATATAAGILDFVNAGGTIADLAGQVEAAGRANEQQDSARVLDINDDGWDDAVIAITGPTGDESGSVFILLCQGDRYVLGGPLSTDEAGAAPILHADADMTGDSSADVLLGWRTCGAHTCLERLEVLSASGAQIIRHALDPSVDLPYPDVAVAVDGSVAATATGIASIGAGPFRRFTRTWAWDSTSQAFRLISEEFEPPRYRIHVLLDADAAARLGDEQAALNLYHRVVLDDTLEDWLDPATERANLTGYAMFRVVLTYLQMNDEGDAQKAFGILQNQYPSGTVGRAYASMAQAFWDSYSATEDLERACGAAGDFAEAHTDEILTPLYFGYANPVYTSADICVAEGL